VKAATFRLFVLILCLASGGSMLAQEGHPLKGSWIGTWTGSKVHSNDLLLVLNWDGKQITGIANPGTDDMMIQNASLNPEGWVVHLELDGKDSKGTAVHYVLDGKIENLAFRNRTITGTWKSTTESGQLKLQRQ
jgi:hypothetical protein